MLKTAQDHFVSHELVSLEDSAKFSCQSGHIGPALRQNSIWELEITQDGREYAVGGREVGREHGEYRLVDEAAEQLLLQPNRAHARRIRSVMRPYFRSTCAFPPLEP